MKNQTKTKSGDAEKLSFQKIVGMVALTFCMVVVLGATLCLIFNAFYKPGSIITIDGVNYKLVYDYNPFTSGTLTVTGLYHEDSDEDSDYESLEDVSITTNYITHSVVEIGAEAFSGETNIKSVNISKTIKTIGDYAFKNCSSLESITVDSGNTTYKAIDGNLYSYDGTELVQYAIGKTDTEFTIPDGVTTIRKGAFYGCTSLESITIPDSVTSIERGAFEGCESLVSVTFANTSGWYAETKVVDSSGKTVTVEVAVEVTDEFTAAGYLTSTYCSYDWYRK